MNRNIHSSQHQNGAALVVGLLLLVIITLMTVFGVRVGVFEQRMSSNHYRHKQSFHAAEAGIAAGIEFIKLNQGQMLGERPGNNWFESDLWTSCQGTEIRPDPCAYLSADMQALGAGGVIYKYDDADDFLDIPAVADTDTPTGYRVMALLCVLNAEEDQCLHDINRGDTDDFAIQLVAFGNSDDSIGESALSTVVAPFPTIHADVAAPVIANSFASQGTFDLATNPNGGGTGIPMSVWTPEPFGLKGDAVTCNQDEFFHTFGKTGPVVDADSGVTTCVDCECPKISGSENDMEWMPLTNSAMASGDIVDGDPDFPADLFKYLFGRPVQLYREVRERAANIEPNCDALDATTSGLYWIAGSCNLNGQIGTPGDPIFLIAGCGNLTVQSSSTIFGLIYIHNLDTDVGVCDGPNVKIAGGTQIYGAVVSDETINFGSGSSQVIFSTEVLKNISNEDRPWGPIPGTWRDYLE